MQKIHEILDERQMKEIDLAKHYTENLNHGTDGHNRLNLIYRLYMHIKELEWFIEGNNK